MSERPQFPERLASGQEKSDTLLQKARKRAILAVAPLVVTLVGAFGIACENSQQNSVFGELPAGITNLNDAVAELKRRIHGDGSDFKTDRFMAQTDAVLATTGETRPDIAVWVVIKRGGQEAEDEFYDGQRNFMKEVDTFFNHRWSLAEICDVVDFDWTVSPKQPFSYDRGRIRAIECGQEE